MSAAPGTLGYRWPAEWEPHSATWLTWPHNVETWAGELLRGAEAAFALMVETLSAAEEVRINVASDAHEASARRALEARGVDPDRGVRFFRIPSNDAWVRDHGPIFLVRDEAPRQVIADFRFNAWGGKYPPWDLDDAVTRHVAERLGTPRFEAEFVLEGGAIDGDGGGTVLTTEQCLLHPNRRSSQDASLDPSAMREEVERRLREWLGARHVVWLPDGIAGDDTDGHVDDVARFVAPGRIVLAMEDDPSDANFEALRANRQRLAAARDQQGRPFEVIELPMPPPVVHAGDRTPASYANFYLANGVALIPTFGAPSDARALAIFRELLPDRRIVAVPSRELIVGLGSIHCLTQSQPA